MVHTQGTVPRKMFFHRRRWFQEGQTLAVLNTLSEKLVAAFTEVMQNNITSGYRRSDSFVTSDGVNSQCFIRYCEESSKVPIFLTCKKSEGETGRLLHGLLTWAYLHSPAFLNSNLICPACSYARHHFKGYWKCLKRIFPKLVSSFDDSQERKGKNRPQKIQFKRLTQNRIHHRAFFFLAAYDRKFN